MNDLKTTGAQSQNQAPISPLAQGKLRSLSAAGSVAAEQEGMLDAFSEVFAAMAAATDSQELNVDQGAEVEVSSNNDENASEEVEANSETDDSDDVKLTSDDQHHKEEAVEATAVETTDTAESISDDDQSEHDHEDVYVPVAEEADQGEQVAVKGDEGATVGDGTELVDETPLFTIDDGDKGKNRRGNEQQAQQAEGPEIVQRTDNTQSSGDDAGKNQTEADLAAVTAQTSDDGSEQDGDGRRRKKSRGRDGVAGANALKDAQAKPTAQQSQDFAVSQTEAEPTTPAPQENATPQASPAARRAAVAAVTGAPSANNAANTNSQSGANRAASSVEPIAEAGNTKADNKPAATGKKGKSATSNPSDAVNRAKLVQRVSKAFQHLGPDGGVVRLRLAPAELGSVRVEMRINGRNMNARVVAETEAASSMLREHLGDLRQRLESYGMQIESIQVETDSGESNLDGRFQNQHEATDSWNQQRNRQPRQQVNLRDQTSVSQDVSPAPRVSSSVGWVSSAGVDLHA